MGGQVSYHPQGKEVGTVEIRLRPEAQNDRLFQNLPEQFPVHATHSQSVLTLPPGAIHLAENGFDPHHAMRIGSCAWGVQFHPEYNVDITRDYVNAQAKLLTDAGQDVDALLAGLRETPEAASLLQKFATLALA
jgi:GMP synthase (glutamine-hydrolysing)